MQTTRTSQTGISSKPADLLRCWCGSDRWRLCFRTARGGLARCVVCGCYQTDPPPLTCSDQSEEFYTRYYSQLPMSCRPLLDPANSYTAGFWRVAEQFSALREISSRAVDVGCGDGHLCAELKGYGWPEVVGVEVSATRATRAQAFYPGVTFFDRPLSKTNLQQESFDLIVMESVIEHLPEPVAQLCELRRYTRLGGRVVVTTPNMDSGNFRLLGRRWTGMLAPHAHIFLFTANALGAAVRRAGFRVEAIGSFQLETYTVSQLIRRFLSGDFKGARWRAHQELGTAYGRLIQQQLMLYAVGRAE